jgi:hypothetical protein
MLTSTFPAWSCRVFVNNGSCALPEDTRLVFVGGHMMDGPRDGVPVGAVPPLTEFEVTVQLVTPHENGQYRGDWQLESRSAGENGEPLAIGSRCVYAHGLGSHGSESCGPKGALSWWFR